MIDGKTVRNAGGFVPPRPEGFLICSGPLGDDNDVILDLILG
jgi:hypothetical protein